MGSHVATQQSEQAKMKPFETVAHVVVGGLPVIWIYDGEEHLIQYSYPNENGGTLRTDRFADSYSAGRCFGAVCADQIDQRGK